MDPYLLPQRNHSLQHPLVLGRGDVGQCAPSAGLHQEEQVGLHRPQVLGELDQRGDVIIILGHNRGVDLERQAGLDTCLRPGDRGVEGIP